MKTGVKHAVKAEEKLVSARGQLLITKYLVDLELNADVLGLSWWSWEWIKSSGYYRGKLPKRLFRVLKSFNNIALTSEQISEIGNIARAHMLPFQLYIIDFDDRLNWNAGDFGDSGSCFWTCRAPARDVLRDNGVLAIRLYKDDKGYARAWVYKINKDTWILFNAYGVDTHVMANIFARFLSSKADQSWIYGDMDCLEVNDDPTGLIYINPRSQVVYAEDTSPPCTVVLDWDVGEYIMCYNCEDIVLVEDALGYCGDYYCDNCYDGVVVRCTDCNDIIENEYIYDGDTLCECCYKARQEGE